MSSETGIDQVRGLAIEHKRLCDEDKSLTAGITASWHNASGAGEQLRRQRDQVRIDRKSVRRRLHDLWTEVLEDYASLIVAGKADTSTDKGEG